MKDNNPSITALTILLVLSLFTFLMYFFTPRILSSSIFVTIPFLIYFYYGFMILVIISMIMKMLWVKG